jgi:ribosome maturation protein Sdo1
MVEKYKKDPSIALINVLQSFQVFQSNTHSPQGIVLKPSKEHLKQAFGTTDENEIAKTILTQGRVSALKESTHSKGYIHPN